MKNGPKTLIFPFCETLNNFGHDSKWSPVFEFKYPKNFQLKFINITGFCIDMATALNESMIFFTGNDIQWIILMLERNSIDYFIV